MSEQARIADLVARLAEAEQRIKAALEFAEQWQTLSEVSVGMMRILKGEPNGIEPQSLGKSNPGATHSSRCWKWHPQCAKARLEFVSKWVADGMATEGEDAKQWYLKAIAQEIGVPVEPKGIAP